MNRLKVLSSVLVLLGGLSHTSRGQGIDSTRWPFPDTLRTGFTIIGMLRTTNWAAQNNKWVSDTSSGRGYCSSSSCYETPCPKKEFTWRDVLVDSDGWHFSSRDQYHKVQCDLVLDTVKKIISTWSYDERYILNSDFGSELSIQLNNISYSTSAIWFPDTNLSQHLSRAYFHSRLGNFFEGTDKDLLGVDTLIMFGQELFNRKQQDVGQDCYFVQNLKLIPNPACTGTTLYINSTILLNSVKITIYDVAGRLIKTQELDAKPEGIRECPIELPSMRGAAFLRVASGMRTIGVLPILIEN